ncbi:Phage tail protein (plasmid) [Rhodovastum atsumiense]|uniref:Phage tail protein n=1 Tax=Rhodovastum atsumiense TaxID=504468 RepID=A0A5M6IQA1_9PROT|nr:phage tail protein [Rhodovastum atsumiense]KAA5609655.1 phage tail protein [Rhodovastum atsumiense]CAH2606522.1 Phage tail protein [Rhodovastum atsumiense]
MPIVQQGSINTTALVVPDLYVQIVPPQNLVLNGVPTNVVGVVGTASWGPVGKPVIIGTMADYAVAFGPVMNRKYDMGTQVATAVQQGASNFRCVRVSDGTDTAAVLSLGTTWLTLTAIYTGSRGGSIVATWGTGSKANTSKLTIALPGQVPEVFDNLGGTGNALAVAAAAAINNGQSALRGPSQLVTATAGAGTTAPTAGTTSTVTTQGTDGATTITAAVLVGVDTIPRKGMYALRGQGCSIGVLADADDTTQWTTQAAFGLAEGVYMIVCGPSGDTISNAVTTKNTAGLDSYAVKVMFGDWIYWNDQVNGVLRLVSPQGFVAGRLANLSPEQSSLNKPLYGVVGSQKSGAPGSGQATTYSSAELQTLFQAGIDVIANPQPGGNFWGVRCGHNSSSNAGTNGDNYTRMTNYIAATLDAGMGDYVGRVMSDDWFRNVKATLDAFCTNMRGQGMIADYGVICSPPSAANTNNPQSRVSLGYGQADVQVQYLSINEKFIVNVEGGQTVQIVRQSAA